jgi:hypothetical protein
MHCAFFAHDINTLTIAFLKISSNQEVNRSLKMTKIILLALVVVFSSKCFANETFEGERSLEKPARGDWCDLETGRIRCTDFCEEKGYNTGFCHQGRMTCNCYYNINTNKGGSLFPTKD